MHRLELTWIGKQQRSHPEPRVLLENSDRSHVATVRHAESDIFENKLVFGDNLIALKSIENDYCGAVKCIFIDPPYNTGSAFEHYDDGIEHSLWLSLLSERISILYRLLASDGSMWITIDDTESHYLKVLCDEIFGRENFVANVVWQKKYTVANDAKWFSDNHDHILVYAKNKMNWHPNRLPRSEEMNGRYANPDNDPKGPWKATPLHAKSGSDKSKRFEFRFSNGVRWSPPPGTFPRFSEETLRRLDADNAIWFGRDGNAMPSRKTYRSELANDGIPPLTIWFHSDVGHNHEAKTEVKAFNSNEVFATPKPERLLHRILHIATNPGDIVLDSFAGSGTTGAVAHKMGRRWIMIELGEHCHTHIIPRLKKVIDGEDPGGITEVIDWKGGGGFRYYRLAPSLLAKDRWGNWVVSDAYNAAMLAEAVCKLMGFTYAPSDQHYWMHGRSSERDFIYVTTQSLTDDQFKAIAAEVGEERSLLVCCQAFRCNPEAFPNLTIRKIPRAVLRKCEWGKDDYTLNVAGLPMASSREEPPARDDPPEPRRRTGRLGRTDARQDDLFARDGE